MSLCVKILLDGISCSFNSCTARHMSSIQTLLSIGDDQVWM